MDPMTSWDIDEQHRRKMCTAACVSFFLVGVIVGAVATYIGMWS